jgi:hypothetical protein
MAKWEIRFQRFALSFRLPPSPRRSSAWRDEDGLPRRLVASKPCEDGSLGEDGSLPCRANLSRRNQMQAEAQRRREPLAFVNGANEKFHLSPASSSSAAIPVMKCHNSRTFTLLLLYDNIEN